MGEIIINNKKSYEDFGLYLKSFKVYPPEPNIVQIQIPFSNGAMDFSTIGSMGEVTYKKRKIEIEFQLPKLNQEQLSTRYSQILEWLYTGGNVNGEQKLIYTNDSSNYYLAKIESAGDLDNFLRFGILKLEFMVQPLKYKIDEFGDDIWDDINFETDYMSPTNQFTISGTTALQIGNGGMNVSPVITSTAVMTLTFEEKSYNLVSGENFLYDLRLKNGINELTINGTGTITLSFREQRL